MEYLNSTTVSHRSYRIDVLKTLAIISICLYHVGAGTAFTQAYLGVEIFFTISGYLMMRSAIICIEENRYSAIKYISKQLKRLWEPIFAGIIVSLAVGYFFMLPDNYENLAESAVASSLFLENILELITTKNYWDVVNTYKPLMHLWYIGSLVQIQFTLAIIFWAITRLCKNKLKCLKVLTVVLAGCSFISYVIPIGSEAVKFYFPWYRLYEVLFGSMVVLFKDTPIQFKSKWIRNVAVVVLFVLLFVPMEAAVTIKVVLSVLCACCLLKNFQDSPEKENTRWKYIAKIGEASYSIYVVHQIIVAYMYYCVVDEFAYNILPGYIGAVIAASALMYLLVENKAVLFHKKKQPQMYMLAGVCVVLVIGSLGIYLRAGVVKDVPELDISVNEYHRGMHAEYCDIPYSWNKEFDTTDKIKVLVLGNSFGRDWANVLSESEMSANLEISYLPFHTETNLEGNEDVLIRRAKKADIIFYVLGPDYDDISEKYLMILPKDKLYVVGNKNFGKSNGIIYSQRNSNNYLNLSIELPEELIESNKQMKEKYGDRYIDILSYVQVSDKEVRVFTENGKFISQDCRHLTENGAKYLAQHISWNDISSNQSGKG